MLELYEPAIHLEAERSFQGNQPDRSLEIPSEEITSRETKGAERREALLAELTGLIFLDPAEYDPDQVFVAGGQEIYRAFLPWCHTAHVTYIDYAYEADAYFPNLDQDPEWKMDLETEEATYFDLCYSFRRYVRR